MSTATLKHIKINVVNASKTAQLLSRLFNWKIDRSEHDTTESHSIQIGNGSTQLVLISSQAQSTQHNTLENLESTIASIAISADDLTKVEQEVIDAGFQTYAHVQTKARRTFCFRDLDGIEYLISNESYNKGDFSRSWIRELAKMSEFGAMIK